MSTLGKISAIAVAVACSIPLAAGAAAAHQSEDKEGVAARESGLEIVEVRIYARDIATGEDLAWVNPGDTLILPPRIEVRLRLEALPRSKGPRYPSASYAVNESKPVADIMNAKPEVGSATLQTFGRTGRSTLRYEVLDNSLKLGALRAGNIVISVEESTELSAPAEPEVTDESLVEALYHAILLRDPEPAAVAAAAARLQRGGYQEAIAIAEQIAASDESTSGVYDRGASPEQRLEALYRHLLGVERADVDANRWSADMRWVRTRNIQQVVSGMVRSQSFQDRFGFDARRNVRDTRGVRYR